jgi:hypothetical protein
VRGGWQRLEGTVLLSAFELVDRQRFTIVQSCFVTHNSPWASMCRRGGCPGWLKPLTRRLSPKSHAWAVYGAPIGRFGAPPGHGHVQGCKSGRRIGSVCQLSICLIACVYVRTRVAADAWRLRSHLLVKQPNEGQHIRVAQATRRRPYYGVYSKRSLVSETAGCTVIALVVTSWSD